MGKLKKITYSLKDVAVVQAPVSYTNHRSDVDPKIKICGRKSYPIFVAPMASVTDENNYKVWTDKTGLLFSSTASRITQSSLIWK